MWFTWQLPGTRSTAPPCHGKRSYFCIKTCAIPKADDMQLGACETLIMSDCITGARAAEHMKQGMPAPCHAAALYVYIYHIQPRE
jgi:hypothetical protein